MTLELGTQPFSMEFTDDIKILNFRIHKPDPERIIIPIFWEEIVFFYSFTTNSLIPCQVSTISIS